MEYTNPYPALFQDLRHSLETDYPKTRMEYFLQEIELNLSWLLNACVVT